MIEAWLTELKGQRVRILRPQRGERADYMRLVQQNAEQNLKAFLMHQEATESASANALSELAAALDLPGPPHRIECYDISNIQGTNRRELDGRLRRRAGEEERLSAFQNPIRSRVPTILR